MKEKRKKMCLFTDSYDFCSVVGELLFWRLLGQIKGHTHQSSGGRQEPALPKRLAWRGRGEGTENPVPMMWPSIFFSCLSVG